MYIMHKEINSIIIILFIIPVRHTRDRLNHIPAQSWSANKMVRSNIHIGVIR
jgi:hypothetical protein